MPVYTSTLRNPFSNSGFSLLELVATLLIVSVLMSLALPAMSQLLASNARDNFLYKLRTTLNYARIYAINSDRYVTMCPFDGRKCVSQWRKEIIVFEENESIGEYNLGERILIHLDNSAKEQLSYQRKLITFSPTGLLYGLSNGSFSFCPTDKTVRSMRITVSSIGRVRLRDQGNCN